MTDPWTIIKLLNWAADYFTAKGIDSPRLDAELLLSHALGLRRIDLYLQFDKAPLPAELATFKELVRRRAAREPVAYILGRKEFWSRQFVVTRDVLIPRPETEILVAAVIDLCRRWQVGDGLEKATPLTGIDVGTGSGIIAVTLLAEVPQLQVTAIDVSEAAIAVARENAQKHGVADRIEFVQASIFDLSSAEVRMSAANEKFNLIVSNPPYIVSSKITELAPEIARYEPAVALDGGADGLDFYRSLVPFAATHLDPGGAVAVEIGEEQGLKVSAMFRASGFSEVAILKDHARHDRVVVGYQMSSRG